MFKKVVKLLIGAQVVSLLGLNQSFAEGSIAPQDQIPKIARGHMSDPKFRQWQADFIYQAVTDYNIGLLRMRQTISLRGDDSIMLKKLCVQVSEDCSSPKKTLLEHYIPVMPSSVIMRLAGYARYGGHRSVRDGFNWFYLPCTGDYCGGEITNTANQDEKIVLAWFDNPAQSIFALMEKTLFSRVPFKQKAWVIHPDNNDHADVHYVSEEMQKTWAVQTYGAATLSAYDDKFWSHVGTLPMAKWTAVAGLLESKLGHHTYTAYSN